jgi:purine-nucleoside phosphorylase
MSTADGHIEESTAIITARSEAIVPKIGLVLGSGLSSFADRIDNPIIIPFGDLPGFPKPAVSGHEGRLVLGTVGGTSVATMQGRTHYYEAADAEVMKVPIQTLKSLGCEAVVLTNAAGSLNPNAGPGSVMLISDHINFMGVSPLFGEVGNGRFVDMTNAYDIGFLNEFKSIADGQGVRLHKGVYMCFGGTQFATPAEIRAAKTLGATCVGMSTVPEVILACHAGLRVVALSIITNFAAGMGDTKLSHEQTLRNAKIAAEDVHKLLVSFLSSYKS